MEKPTARTKRKWLLGLLIVVAGAALAEAQSVASQLRSLRFRKVEDYFFTSSNCTFAIDIESIPPGDVALYINAIPDNVELLSVKKETYIPPAGSGGKGYGTHIVIVVRFSKVGDYRLFSADLQVKEGYFKIPFEEVHVYENIQVLKPELSVQFDSPPFTAAQRTMQVRAGEHVVFTVYVKYAADVQSLAWNIPENSLFKELRRYRVLDADAPKMEFSLEQLPVATFDWQPLFAGSYRLPPVEVVATAYNGSRMIVDFPAYTLTVTQAPVQEGGGAAEVTFADAFAAPDEQLSVSDAVQVSGADIRRLLELHRKERFSLPFLSRATVERQEAELSLGLPAGKAEPSVPLFVLFVVFACLAVALAVLCFAMRHIPWGVVCVIAALLLGLGALIGGHNVRTVYALFTGGEVLPIPEKELSRGFTLQAGSVVRVVKKTDSWLYIAFNDTYGWILKESVILIR